MMIWLKTIDTVRLFLKKDYDNKGTEIEGKVCSITGL